tara:strand:+ start:3563 stop:4309 length:747 start_codon:yes stop_codon:yes gene_type:complete
MHYQENVLKYKNDTTLLGNNTTDIPPDKLFTHSEYCFDIENEIYPLLISKNVKNPYTTDPLWTNDKEKLSIFNHTGLNIDQRSNLLEKFKHPELNEEQKNNIYDYREILYDIAIRSIKIYNDNTNDFSISLLELYELNKLLPNDILNMKRIISLNNYTYIYGDTLYNLICNANQYCIHAVGEMLLEFYIFYYNLYFKEDFRNWVIIRNAILSEWDEKNTFSMTFYNPYGYSEGSYKFFRSTKKKNKKV